ncbi:MAG: type II secretion system F family protein [Myxococcaceae bacterium]
MVSAARPGAQPSSSSERIARAWYRHPVVQFLRHRQVITFYTQLHSMVRAGVALGTAFTQLRQYAPSDDLRRGLEAVEKSVLAGQSLGDAMRTHGGLFDDANVELIAFAEEAGRLEPVLAALVAHLERVQKQRWQAILGALWPLYLAGAVVFIGPLFGVAAKVSAGQGIGQAYLSGLSSTLGFAVATLGALLGFPFVVALVGGEVGWDRFKRGLPGFGAPMRTLAASRFVMGLGLATASGMEVVRTLRLSAKATSSPSVLADLPQAEAVVRAGGTLAAAVGTLRLLDATDMGQVAVAETTGTLDETLQRLAKQLEERSLRAMRFLVLGLTVIAAGLLLMKIVAGLLATIMGPVKTFYDAAGSGKIPGE